MDAERRKKIEVIQGKLDDLHNELTSLKDEEQAALENTPESFQDRREVMEQIIEWLGEAADGLESAKETLDNTLA